MKTVAIIQARMGSSRLPGKMMMDLCGSPVIQRVVDRVRLARRLDAVWLATTVDPGDDVLAGWAEEYYVPCFRGSVHDVLDRYDQTAKAAGADVIVRVTGDCPLIDPAVIDAVIDAHHTSGADYTCNNQPPTFPDGLDTEVVSFSALEKAWKEATLPSEREHVMPYIWKHPERFHIKNYTVQMNGGDSDLSHERWTLDTPEDLDFLRHVISALDEIRGKTMNDILLVIRAHPEWRNINAKYTRNEGYTQSLQSDVA